MCREKTCSRMTGRARRYCPRNGKEGVDGSSPSEGFSETPANRAFWLSGVSTDPERRTHFGHSLASRTIRTAQFRLFSRMHWANLRRSASGWVLPSKRPGGCKSLHAPMVFFHAAVLGSSAEPLSIPYANSPDASGSGNSLTPFSRMHSANFTAFSWLAAFVLPALPFSAGALETAHADQGDHGKGGQRP
jgi:hypothetical protein